MTSATFDEKLSKDLCNLEFPRKIKFSPDGQRLIYSTTLAILQRKDKYQISKLWLASTTIAGSSRLLTSGKCNDQAPAWHPDCRQMAFTSDRSKPGESSAIWMLRLDGGDATALIPADNEKNIDVFAFSPDGRTIAYVSTDEKSYEEREKKKVGKPVDPYVWGHKWEFARLRLVNIATGRLQTLVSDNRHVGNIAWSPDGTSIAFETTENPTVEEKMITGTRISAVDIASNDITHLCTFKRGVSQLTWAPDGKIYCVTYTPDDRSVRARAVYSLDPAAASPEYFKIACGTDDNAAERGGREAFDAPRSQAIQHDERHEWTQLVRTRCTVSSMGRIHRRHRHKDNLSCWVV